MGGERVASDATRPWRAVPDGQSGSSGCPPTSFRTTPVPDGVSAFGWSYTDSACGCPATGRTQRARPQPHRAVASTPPAGLARHLRWTSCETGAPRQFRLRPGDSFDVRRHRLAPHPPQTGSRTTPGYRPSDRNEIRACLREPGCSRPPRNSRELRGRHRRPRPQPGLFVRGVRDARWSDRPPPVRSTRSERPRDPPDPPPFPGTGRARRRLTAPPARCSANRSSRTGWPVCPLRTFFRPAPSPCGGCTTARRSRGRAGRAP